MKVHYNATQNFSFDFGIDNVFNEQYFLFHPFPGRTFVMAGKYILSHGARQTGPDRKFKKIRQQKNTRSISSVIFFRTLRFSPFSWRGLSPRRCAPRRSRPAIS